MKKELKEWLNFIYSMVVTLAIIVYIFVVSLHLIPKDNMANVNFIVGILVGSMFGRIINARLNISASPTPTAIEGTTTTKMNTTTVTENPTTPTPNADTTV